MFTEQIPFGPFNLFGSQLRAEGATRDGSRWSSRVGHCEDEQWPLNNVVVVVLERPSPLTAVIAWRDSTSCRYGDQLWRAGIARSKGVCALTGVAIMPGDSIYRPAPFSPRPCNADAMISTPAVRSAVCAAC